MGISLGSTPFAGASLGTTTLVGISLGAVDVLGDSGGGGGPSGELNADPGFDDPAYWGTTAVVIADGKAKFNQPYSSGFPQVLHNGTPFVEGGTYAYSVTISNFGGGNVKPYIGVDPQGLGPALSGNGTYTGTFVAGATGSFSIQFGLQGYDNFIGDIDDFTLTLVP